MREASPRPRPRHFAEPIIREVLRLTFFDRLQHKARHELRLIALGVIGCRSTAGRISNPVGAEVRRRDKRVNLTDDDAVLFQLGARREAEAKKRALRRRINAVLRNGHERSSRIDVHDASAALRAHERDHSLHRDNRPHHVEVKDFVKQGGIDLLYGGRITAPRIVDETVDAAVMLVHGAYGFPHAIKSRHVSRDR